MVECTHFTCRDNDTLCSNGVSMKKCIHYLCNKQRNIGSLKQNECVLETQLAQKVKDLPNDKSMRHNWGIRDKPSDDTKKYLDYHSSLYRNRDEEKMSYYTKEEKPYESREDVNNATAHYCVDCGVKNWILHPEDVEFNKFRCDDCRTWNYIEPKLNKPVKIEREKVPSEPFFFTDERKASIGEFFRSKWKRKHVSSDDANMGSFMSIAFLYVSIAFFIAGLVRLQTPEAELTERQWKVGMFMVMTTIFLVMYLISHVFASYYGLKYNVLFLKDQAKWSSIILLVSSIIGGVAFGIYKLLEGVISIV